MPDLGRYEVTKQQEDRGAFKTPTLRRSPTPVPTRTRRQPEDCWTRSSRALTKGASTRTGSARGVHQDVRVLNLQEQEKKDLVEFLKALSGEGWQHIKPPEELPQ